MVRLVNSALAALVLFSSAAFISCVRNSGDSAEVSAEVLEPGEITDLINNLEKAILTQAMTKGQNVDDFLQPMFAAARGKGDGGGKDGQLDRKAWLYFCKSGLSLQTGQCTKLWSIESLRITDSFSSESFVTIAKVEEAVLGSGTPEEKEEVLKAVWHKLTGEQEPQSGTTLTTDMLKCKKVKTRQNFLDDMAQGAGAPAGTPVTYDMFKAYYFTLCSDCSPRHFVLMVVNAWHLMGGMETVSPTSPTGFDGLWSRVNTVNLRVRVSSVDDSAGGQIVTLWNDCGMEEGDTGKPKLTIIKERLQKQMEDGITPMIPFDQIDIKGGMM